jgi:hypothetical protein
MHRCQLAMACWGTKFALGFYQSGSRKFNFSLSFQAVFSFGVKIFGITSDVSWDVGRGVLILIKKLIT